MEKKKTRRRALRRVIPAPIASRVSAASPPYFPPFRRRPTPSPSPSRAFAYYSAHEHSSPHPSPGPPPSPRAASSSSSPACASARGGRSFARFLALLRRLRLASPLALLQLRQALLGHVHLVRDLELVGVLRLDAHRLRREVGGGGVCVDVLAALRFRFHHLREGPHRRRGLPRAGRRGGRGRGRRLARGRRRLERGRALRRRGEEPGVRVRDARARGASRRRRFSGVRRVGSRLRRGRRGRRRGRPRRRRGSLLCRRKALRRLRALRRLQTRRLRALAVLRLTRLQSGTNLGHVRGKRRDGGALRRGGRIVLERHVASAAAAARARRGRVRARSRARRELRSGDDVRGGDGGFGRV